MRQAHDMSNSELIDYLYEIEDFNDFVSVECEDLEIERFLFIAQQIVDKHLTISK